MWFLADRSLYLPQLLGGQGIVQHKVRVGSRLRETNRGCVEVLGRPTRDRSCSHPNTFSRGRLLPRADLHSMAAMSISALLISAVAASTAAAAPAAQLTPVLQLAPRAELRADLDGSDAAKTPLILISRFGAAAQLQKWRARAVGQAISRFGDSHRLDLYEGWLQRKGQGWSLRAGRQVIVWNEMRLMGHRLWRPHALAHDALRLKAKGNAWRLDVIAGKPFDEERTFAGARAGYRWGGSKRPKARNHGLVDVLALRDAATWTERARVTAGAFSRAWWGLWTARAEAYVQSGQTADGTEVSAQMASVLGGRKVGDWLVSGFVDYLSGDAPGSPKNSGAFHIVHGARHPYYGLMDIAVVREGGFADGRGLIAAGLQGKFRRGPWRALVNLTPMHFAARDTLGAELDAVLRYNVSVRSAVIAGGGVLTDPGSQPRVFGYVSWVLKLGRR